MKYKIVKYFKNYFLKIKNTANIKHKKPIKWLSLKVSVLKNIIVKIVKIVRVITSCITLSCKSENGPPFSENPILFAGTWKQYSNNAIPQLININQKKDN